VRLEFLLSSSLAWYVYSLMKVFVSAKAVVVRKMKDRISTKTKQDTFLIIDRIFIEQTSVAQSLNAVNFFAMLSKAGKNRSKMSVTTV
jgi:hypothetical protein